MEVEAGVMRTPNCFANLVVPNIDESVLNNEYYIEAWLVCRDPLARVSQLNRMRGRDCQN